MEEAYERARAIIEANNDKINAMADLLLEKETIYAEDIIPILGESAQTKAAKMENPATEENPTPAMAGVTVAD
jgi:hypothetical protein